MSQAAVFRPSLRLCLLSTALLAALLLLLTQLHRLTALPLIDFVEYWAAGRLNVHGENPYDPAAVHQLERAAGRDYDGILMWNPPWTLPLVMPLGLLDCRTAHLLWLAVQGIILVWCGDALWRLYGGASSHRGLAWLLALTFLPSLFALTAGQIVPFVLLGAVLFLVFVQQGRDFLAGASLVLLAIKPHLAYLFWIVLLCWCVSRRRWAILGGGVLTGAAALGVAMLCNPAVLGQYWHTFTHQPPAQYRSPTLGTVLRLWFGEEHFRLQFLALLPGLAWVLPYGLRHRRDWEWSERMPLLLLVSMLTAAYGAWLFDLALLLVPVLQMAARTQRDTWKPAALTYLAINAVAAGQLAVEVEYFAFIWMTPALLLAYLALRRHTVSALVANA